MEHWEAFVKGNLKDPWGPNPIPIRDREEELQKDILKVDTELNKVVSALNQAEKLIEYANGFVGFTKTGCQPCRNEQHWPTGSTTKETQMSESDDSNSDSSDEYRYPPPLIKLNADCETGDEKPKTAKQEQEEESDDEFFGIMKQNIQADRGHEFSGIMGSSGSSGSTGARGNVPGARRRPATRRLPPAYGGAKVTEEKEVEMGTEPQTDVGEGGVQPKKRVRRAAKKERRTRKVANRLRYEHAGADKKPKDTEAERGKTSGPPPIEHFATHRPAHPNCAACETAKMHLTNIYKQATEAIEEEREKLATLEMVGADTIGPTKPDIHGNHYLQNTRDRGQATSSALLRQITPRRAPQRHGSTCTRARGTTSIRTAQPSW